MYTFKLIINTLIIFELYNVFEVKHVYCVCHLHLHLHLLNFVKDFKMCVPLYISSKHNVLIINN